MKIIIAFFFAAFFAGASIAQDQAQNQQGQPPSQGWYQQLSSAAGGAGSIFFINRDTGWVTFGNGLFSTINGGTTWTLLSPPPTYIGYFADANNGWGQNDTALIRTSDGGKNWIPVYAPVTGQMQVFGMDTLYIYDAGSRRFARSTNAGQTWSDTVLDAVRGRSMSFAYSKLGFIGGFQILWFGPYPPQKGTNGAGLLVTTDGGITWTQKYCPLQEDLDLIHALDSSKIIANTSDANIVNSSDGGLTWDTTGYKASINSFFFLNKKTGYAACGTGDILFTGDSGKTWSRQNSTVNTELTSIFFVDSLSGWASGYDPAVILHTTNGGTSLVSQPPSYDSLSIQTFPDPVTGSSLNYHYILPSSQHVTLTLFDLMGNQVQIFLQNDFEDQGEHTVPITLLPFSNGSYYYQFQTEEYQSSGKITIIR